MNNAGGILLKLRRDALPCQVTLGTRALGIGNPPRFPAAASSTPRATPSQLQRRATVSTSVARASARVASGSSNQRSRRSAIASTAPGSIGNDVSGATARRLVGGEALGDLAHARVAGGDRQRAAGGGLDRDHPEGLGEGARHHQGLGAAGGARRPRRARAGRATRPSRRRRGRPRRSPAAGRRGRRRGSAAASPLPPRAPSRPRRRRGRPRGRRGRAPSAGGAARPRRRRSPPPGGARRGCLARTSGQAARSRSTPLETISLPTKTTSGSRPALDRGELLDVDAGRAEPRLRPSGRADPASAAQSDSPVWAEPTRTPWAASIPS